MFPSKLRAPAALLLVFAVCVVAGGRACAGDVAKDFEAFLKTPNRQNYVKVFQQIVSSPKYDPYSSDLDDAAALLDKGQFQQAQAKLDESAPNLLLSPRAHILAGLAAERLADADKARQQQLAAARCLEGILSTGGGSAASPYLVTRTSDEYDVLRQMKKEMAFQSLRKVDGKQLDVLRCTDGSEVCFDITAIFETLNRRIRKK